MASGSAVLSPNGNATLGEAGVNITSHLAYAAAKSIAISRRTRS